MEDTFVTDILARTRVTWSDDNTLMLYQYCVDEVEASDAEIKTCHQVDEVESAAPELKWEKAGRAQSSKDGTTQSDAEIKTCNQVDEVESAAPELKWEKAGRAQSSKDGTTQSDAEIKTCNQVDEVESAAPESKWEKSSQMLADASTFKEMIGKYVAELDFAMTRSIALEETCSSQTEKIKDLEETCSSQTEKIKTLELQLALANEKLKVHTESIVVAETLALQELKGNIRVFCRVRPLLPNESTAVAYPKSGENLGRGIELTHNAQLYSFTFDKVFEQSASQEDVFVEISQLVQSALDGYKVCLFAYGQTGSGKTYTMMGNPESQDQKGLIPRSLEQIFQTSQALISQGWKYKMQASMLEIYNEAIRDLLATHRTTIQDGGASKYSIKHDAYGNTHVSDLTIIDVSSINEVSSLLKRAAWSRSVGRTQMNEESSRSHCVFTLRIFAVHEGTNQQVQGVLNLIDLAGSERLNKSGATGDRLKETQAINKSLSCLSDVIFSIANKEEHVPFRNSKLTYLLQPCLGGGSKTLVFVNLSPEVSSTGESICSLRFAARVNSCEIGIPRRQTQGAPDASDMWSPTTAKRPPQPGPPSLVRLLRCRRRDKPPDDNEPPDDNDAARSTRG
ncbi:hypothetical protein OsI_34377 [Oryza sativa Indica Group]|uniref:Kinesin-like protein n=1 Tax=Oryza sativa subsp. indica TaxID=39946 RepID=A2Z9H7_ORYSI|nr:hypothetical protein OsI_34377 [Oryza sativa Indica Group]